eukprot:TRINITY_DN49841_c0_g1_i1.p1 TRINITY_DN49841_c0_g1~~TRINITY_DN49841_c0_g1_i1.p1  ORF type:complete len:689 (-),score=124.53 TRINITY_DN49841_c0_g1_i1:83-2149(-)
MGCGASAHNRALPSDDGQAVDAADRVIPIETTEKTRRTSRKGSKSEAPVAFKKADDISDEDKRRASELLAEGESRYFNDEIERAEELFGKAIELDPSNAEAFICLGKVHYNHKRDYEKAEYFYTEALARNSRHSMAHNFLGVLFEVQRRKYAEAEREYKLAIECDPQNAKALYNIACYYAYTKEDFPLAEKYYRSAVELNHKEARFWLARLLTDRLERDEDAVHEMQKAAKDGHPRAVRELEALQIKIMQAAAAKRHSLDLLLEGDTKYSNKEVDRAEKLWIKAVELDPSNAEALYCLGKVYHNDKRDFNKAELFYKKALAQNERHSMAHNNLGVVLEIERKQYMAAEREFKLAIECDPQNSKAIFNLACYYAYTKKDYTLAEKFYRTAAELNHREARYWLARVLIDYFERYEDAVYEMQQAARDGHPRAATELDNLERKAISLGKHPMVTPAPNYWATAEGIHIIPDPGEIPEMQALLTSTWVAKYTRDRMRMAGSREVPSGARVVNVLRVENHSSYQKYCFRLAKIRASRAGRCERFDVETSSIGTNLHHDVNELYLFHGTTPSAADAIAKGEFRLDLSGTAAGCMFGRGIYLAENASKSDEYSKPGDGIFLGMHALLLCRAVAGKVGTVQQAGDSSVNVKSGHYDSICGDRRAAVNTYREMIFFSEDQVYCEYIIIYSRLFEDAG